MYSVGLTTYSLVTMHAGHSYVYCYNDMNYTMIWGQLFFVLYLYFALWQLNASGNNNPSIYPGMKQQSLVFNQISQNKI